MKRFELIFLCIWLGLVTLFIQPVLAATLAIEPREIIFSAQEKFSDATLFNLGDEPVLLRLKLVDMAMTEDGGLVPLEPSRVDENPVPGADYPFASGLLRVVPRQITIQPNGKQKIRILAHHDLNRHGRKPTDGAYHTHLFLTVIPSLDEFTDLQNAAQPGEATESPSAEGAPDKERQASIGIIPVMSLAYPVWFETGSGGDARTLISNPVLWLEEGTMPVVNVRIDRTGTGRLKGDLVILARRPGHETDIRIGQRTNVSIYPEADRIATSVRLDSKALADAGLTADSLAGDDISLRAQFTTTVPEARDKDGEAVQSAAVAVPDLED